MNITIVYGQNNKGNTYKLTQLLLDTLGRENHSVTELFPKDYGQALCLGCTNCFLKGENTCPHAEQVQTAVGVLDNADLLVFSSACYVMNMTGSLKNFFDHLGYRYMVHRPNPVMYSKQAVVISTAAGAGMGKVTKAISTNLYHWGVPVVQQYGLRIGMGSFDEIKEKRKQRIQKNIERMAKKIEQQRNIKPGIKTKALFWGVKQMQKRNDWNARDKEYWVQQGWLTNKIVEQ